MKNVETIKKMIDALRKFDKWAERLSEVNIDVYDADNGLQELDDLILDLAGVPPEGDIGFSRDWFTMYLMVLFKEGEDLDGEKVSIKGLMKEASDCANEMANISKLTTHVG